MESNQSTDFTMALPQELVGCICSFMDSLSLCQALLVNKKLHTIGSKYIENIPKVMHNPSHIYALVIGPERSGKSCLTAIMSYSSEYTRTALHTTTNTCNFTDFQVTFLNTPGSRNKRREVLKHALPCDLPLLVVNTNELTRDQEEDFQHLVLSTHHLINASNHVIVAVNILDEISLDQQRTAYERVHQHISTLLRDLGFNMTRVHFVPVNAFNGTNTRSDLPKFSWHTAPSLTELFTTLYHDARIDSTAHNMLCNAKTKFQVYQRYHIMGIGSVFCGRVLSGTMPTDPTRCISMVHPGEITVAKYKTLESRHMLVDLAKPGYVIGCNTTHDRSFLKSFKGGYGEIVNDSNTFPTLHKTIAFRAELSIHVPHEFGPNRHFTLYYSGIKFTCFVLHVFEDENQSRKIKLPNMEGDVKGSDKIAKQKEAGRTVSRPKRTLLSKATALIVMREEFPLKIATNSPFEKNYDGKIVLMRDKLFIAHGKIKRVIDERIEGKKLDKTNFTRAVYDKLLSRVSELFVLPSEQTLLDKLIEHEKNHSRCQRVFCTEEEFSKEKKERINRI